MALTEKMVKICLIFLFIVQLSYSLKTTSTRGGKDDDASNIKKEEDTKTLKHAVRGAAAQINKSSYLNEVVDAFFESSEDPTEASNLKDEIHILASTEVLKSFLVSVRRQLHRHPEVMYQGKEGIVMKLDF